MANTLFVPARKIISSITNAPRAVVTVTEPHDYVSGEYVRIHIPVNEPVVSPQPPSAGTGTHGMPQINKQYAPIEVIDDTSFYINIDTSAYEPFVILLPQVQFAQCVAIGSVNELLQGAVHNSLNPFFT